MEMEFSQADFNCLLVAEHTRKTSEVNYAKDPLMLRYNHGAYFFLPSYVMRTHGAKQQCETVKRTLRKQLELVFEVRTLAFCSGVLDSLAVELKASKEFSKLYAGIAILWLHLSLS
ncbi:hypothetical protein ES319_A05G332000v1 [Gossypium barbadense]|uniref:Uncharacterized protein n=2 Tax=Gossypium TaxID=3633 RepID=A0A5J5VXQ7_GOSBA|nr:hypothetical protein ES319_A05G332000v1 [Gossypium barbadense]TYH19425.1 hypothetical protein ES288_A05G350900v1 [Gossypium darwinii]